MKLNAKQRALLEEVLSRREPGLLNVLGTDRLLSEMERDAIVNALADEMMLTGLEGALHAPELSRRGIQLDELIGMIAGGRT